MNELAPTQTSRRDLKETLLAPEMQSVFGQLVPRHMTPERMLRLSIACITRTPRLLEVPQVQVLGALVQCAGLGLEPNSPLQHAHLIPFKNNRTQRYDLQMIIGYRGYVELGRRTGKQRWVHADVVRPGDEFEYTYGNNAHLRHRPGRGEQERKAPTDAYCFVQLEDGFAFSVLPEWEILRHREHSFAWRQEKERSPWGQHPDRMWRKTAIRVLYSGGEVPLDTELAMAVATDDQRMDWRAMGDLAMKGGKSAIEHLKEGMDTFVAEQEDEPEERDAAEPELRSQVRRAAPAEGRGGGGKDSRAVMMKELDDGTAEITELSDAPASFSVSGSGGGRGPATPRDIPKTAPGRPTERLGGGGASPEAAERLKHEGATGVGGKRVRRSVEAIKAEIIQNIRNAQTVEEVEAAAAEREQYTSIMGNSEACDEIFAEAIAMINALREADPETGEIRANPELPDELEGVMIDRGEMRESSEFERRHGRAAAEAVGATEPAPASEPVYKLLGLTGTLIQMLPAEEWLDELWDKIEETSPGMREKLLTVNHGVIQRILSDRPELNLRVQALQAKVNEE